MFQLLKAVCNFLITADRWYDKGLFIFNFKTAFNQQVPVSKILEFDYMCIYGIILYLYGWLMVISPKITIIQNNVKQQ